MNQNQQIANTLLRLIKQMPGLFGPAVEQLAAEIDKLGSLQAAQDALRQQLAKLRSEVDGLQGTIDKKYSQEKQSIAQSRTEAEQFWVQQRARIAEAARAKAAESEASARATIAKAEDAAAQAKQNAEAQLTRSQEALADVNAQIESARANLVGINGELSARKAELADVRKHLAAIRTKVA